MPNDSSLRWPLTIEILEIVAALLFASLPLIERRLPIAAAALALFAAAVALRFYGMPPEERAPEPQVESVDDDHPLARPLITNEASSTP
jgi:hypothetical protein